MVAKHGGYTGSVPECHDVPMAPLDSFVQLGLDKAREAILPDYAFALYIPGSWPFPSLMDKTILPETYFTEGNPGEEDANTVTVAKKTRKRKGRKTQNRSKSAGTASSTSEASPARAKTATQTDEERAKQVIQDLHLSSDGSDSEVPDNTGNPSKGADPENSRLDPLGLPTVPDQEPSAPPGILSGDQLPDNGQDKPVPPQPDVSTLDPDASALDPLPKLVHPPGLPSPTPPDSSTAATPGLGSSRRMAGAQRQTMCRPSLTKASTVMPPRTSLTRTLQSYSHCILSGVYREAMVTCLTARTTTTEMTRISVFMTWYLSHPCDAYALPGRLRSTTVGSRPQ